VAQAVEHLLCKHKALSSNPSPTKKKKKEVEECGHKAGDGSSTEMGMAWMGS
jgi:hypothetical protein